MFNWVCRKFIDSIGIERIGVLLFVLVSKEVGNCWFIYNSRKSNDVIVIVVVYIVKSIV